MFAGCSQTAAPANPARRIAAAVHRLGDLRLPAHLPAGGPNAGILRLQQVGKAGLGAGKSPARIHLVHEIKSFQGRRQSAGQADGAGIIDENINPAKSFDRLMNSVLPLRFIMLLLGINSETP